MSFSEVDGDEFNIFIKLMCFDSNKTREPNGKGKMKIGTYHEMLYCQYVLLFSLKIEHHQNVNACAVP